jgi:hypothetical protein
MGKMGKASIKMKEDPMVMMARQRTLRVKKPLKTNEQQSIYDD